MRHKFRVLQTQPITFDLGLMFIDGKPVPGSQRSMTTEPGYRGFRTKKEAAEFVKAITASHGADAVGPVEPL